MVPWSGWPTQPRVRHSQWAPTLEDIREKYGFQPNLFGKFAHSPAPLNAYLSLSEAYEGSSLTPVEQNVVLLSASRENGCYYCVAVHSAMGDMQDHPGEVIDAIRNGEPIPNAKLEALRQFTQSVVRNRGQVDDSVVENFLSAGFEEKQALEVLVGIAMKTLSNYTNSLTKPPLDDAFKAREWSPE